MVTVTPDLVRDRVKLSSTDIEDAKVTDFIKDSKAAIAEETGVKNLAVMRAQDLEVRFRFQSTVGCFWSFLEFLMWLPQALRL